LNILKFMIDRSPALRDDSAAMRAVRGFILLGILLLVPALFAQTPVLPAGSAVNGASFRAAADPGGAIAPGTIVSIFGSNLASETQVAMSVPLSTSLAGTTVTFNDVPAPLFFVSAGQVNIQVPFEVAAGAVTLRVTRPSGSATQAITLASVSPGLFTLNAQGTGAVAALHADTFQVVNASSPARPGEFLLLFCTGLGVVNPPLASGSAAPTNTLHQTVGTPLVNVANAPAEVTFSGLAPGFVGLYQVNIRLPASTPRGTQPIQIVMNGVASNVATVEVQ